MIITVALPLGNGVMTTRTYHPATGRLETVTSSNAAAEVVQSLTYSWDAVGNLLSRTDNRARHARLP